MANRRFRGSRKVLIGWEAWCDDCCFSTYAGGRGRPELICQQEKGFEGRWRKCRAEGGCGNFYPVTSRNEGQRRVIALTQGKFAIVDSEDYCWLNKYKWSAFRKSYTFYAFRRKNGKVICMHREIMGADGDVVVDHIDHNGLNNRRRNLRVCSIRENCRNRRPGKKKASVYKGVIRSKRDNMWTARIKYDGKRIYLGTFLREVDAAKAYDLKAAECFGEFAYLNFPELGNSVEVKG